MLKLPKAIIYDLDGTLIDSLPLAGAGSKYAAKRLGFKITDQQLRFYNGMTNQNFAEHVLKTKDQQKIDAFNSIKREYSNAHFSRITIFKDVDSTIRILKKKVPLWICTSSRKRYVTKVYQQFPSLKQFSRKTITGDMFLKGKPDPEPLIVACKKIGLPPNQVLYIGDAANDYLAAKAAGCSFVYYLRKGFAWDIRVPKTIPRIKNHTELFTLFPTFLSKR